MDDELDEEWVELKDFPGYCLSTLGNVFSVKLNRLLKIGVSGKYPTVNLIYPDGQTRVVYLHVLLARNFVSGWFEDAEVNHKDGNKHNYSLSNLEWVTHSQNLKHAWDNDLIRGKYGKTIKIITPEDRKKESEKS